MDNMQLRALQLVFLYSYSHKKKFEMYIATVGYHNNQFFKYER